MAKQYDVAVIIGRFQPFHNGHLELFKKAAEVADTIMVLIGSSNQPRTPKNPWTWEERSDFIRQSLRFHIAENNLEGQFPDELTKISYHPLHDHLYNDQDWVTEVQEVVHDNIYNKAMKNICLVGHHKEGDASTYYLDMFPQWEYVGTGHTLTNSEGQPITATDIRAHLFGRHLGYRDYVPTFMKSYLNSWMDSKSYKYVLEEYCHYIDYAGQYIDLPYPPVFVTTDACVICCGHILLVKRKHAPGKGLYALPGGFIEQDEYIASGIIRELKEETGIKVPVPVLHGSMKEIEVFDAPKRSLRGRTITHCGLIFLRNDTTLPEVRGSDDADVEGTDWYPLAEVIDYFRPQMFEDHFDIILRMKSLIK